MYNFASCLDHYSRCVHCIIQSEVNLWFVLSLSLVPIDNFVYIVNVIKFVETANTRARLISIPRFDVVAHLSES